MVALHRGRHGACWVGTGAYPWIAQREAAKDPFFKKVWESQREFASLMVPQKWMRHPPYDLAASYYWKR